MRRQLAWVLTLGLFAAGCGGDAKNEPSTKNEMDTIALNDVGELYRTYTAQNHKPPQKLDDFAPMEMMSPTGLSALRRGDVVVRWGATMSETEEGPAKVSSPEVLAYFKDVPEKGGAVLLLDRTIKSMTPDEFKAAPKAGKG